MRWGPPCVLRSLLLLVMELTIGDKVFYSRSTGLRVPAKVVGHFDKAYVELGNHQGGVQVVNQRCPWTPSLLVSLVSIPPCHLRKSLLASPVMRVIAALFVRENVACSARAVQGRPLRCEVLKSGLPTQQQLLVNQM